MLEMNRCVRTGAVSVAFCFGILAGFARANDLPWQTDFEAAKTKAKAEKKMLFVDFTGSDWCIWCKRLKEEVFDIEPFTTDAPKQFEMVELDFPMTKKLPSDLKKQNDALAKQYKIRGYPTILLLDADGAVIARTGYQAGGPDKYQKSLTELVDLHHEVVRMRGELAKAEGADRAKLLDQLIEGYTKLGNEIDEIDTWSKEVIALDVDNKAGLKTKYQVRVWIAEFAQLEKVNKFDEIKSLVEKIVALPGVTDQQKQDAYFAESESLFRQHDLGALVDCLKKALAASPDSPSAPQITALIKTFGAQAEAEKSIPGLKAEAEKAEGPDRAKALDRLLDAYAKLGNRIGGKDQSEDVKKWSREIIALDADNKDGLKGKYEFRVLYGESMALYIAKKYTEAEVSLDKVLALPGLTALQAHNAAIIKSNCYMQQKEFQSALDCLNKSVKDVPEGVDRTPIPKLIEKCEKELENSKKANAQSDPSGSKDKQSKSEEPKKQSANAG